MAKGLPPIREFPRDERIWRLDWVGAVRRIDGVLKVDVFLSPARDNISKPISQKDFEQTEIKKKSVDIGLFPALVIGSLWKNGIRCGKAGVRERLHDVLINDNTVQLERVYVKSPGKNGVISRFSHFIHKDAWPSWCMSITYQGNPRGILLPISELIRFYYGRSTRLARLVFNGNLHINFDEVVDRDLTGYIPETNQYAIHTKWRLSYDELWTLARMVAAPHARKGYRRVLNTLIKETSTGTIFPESHLPFVGVVNWRVRGVEIPMEGKAPQFLVYEIEECDMEFPFEGLMANIGKGDLNDEILEEDGVVPSWQKKVAEPEHGGEIQSVIAPESGMLAENISLEVGNFTFLRNKKIAPVPKTRGAYRPNTLSPVPYLVSSFNTRNSTARGSGTGYLQIEQWHEKEEEQSQHESSEELTSLMKRLAEKGADVQLRPLSPEIGHVPMKRGMRSTKWYYLDSVRGTLRRVSILDIAYENKCASLVDFQRRPKEARAAALFIMQGNTHLPNAQFRLLLEKLAEKEGVWKNVSRMPDGVRLERIQHPLGEYSARIILSKLRR